MKISEKKKKNDEENKLSGEVYVAPPLIHIFHVLNSMPYCPLSHHITARERVEIYKISKLFSMHWPKILTWNAYMKLIGDAYKKIGEIGLYTKISQKEAEKLYQQLIKEGGI